METIKKKYGKCYYGVKTALNEAFIIPEQNPPGQHVKAIFEGKEIQKWLSPEPVQQLILFESKWTKQKYGSEISEEKALELITNDFPELIKQILPFEERAKKRYDKGDFFWELRNCAYYELFEMPKIIFPNLQNGNKFSYDETGSYINAPAVVLPTSDKFLLSILNSKLVWYFLTNICVVRSGGYIEVKPQYFEQIPIPEIKDPLPLENLVNSQINSTSTFYLKKDKFLSRLKSNFTFEKVSKKIETFYDYDFKVLLAELKKQKIDLSLSMQDEWEDYFKKYKGEIELVLDRIDKTDREIDQMVYELYGLTEEEIRIVEEAVKN